jgi:hypothetical protein
MIHSEVGGGCRAKNKQKNYIIYLHLVHSLLEFIKLFYHSIKGVNRTFLDQGCTNPGLQIAIANKFVIVAPNVVNKANLVHNFS